MLVSFRKLFVSCSCCFSLYCCLGIVREKRWEGRLRGRVRVRVRVRPLGFIYTIIKLPVNPNNGGVEARAKPKAS